jgi:replication factor C subunit 3/5
MPPTNRGLWVDAHRPKHLSELTHHPELTSRLQKIAQASDMPHLLFYGPPGGGKKTRVLALLREMFGPAADKLKLEHRQFKTPSNKVLEITLLGSPYHLELNPSDAGIYDRIVVQEVIKEIAQSHALVLSDTSSSNTTNNNQTSSSSSGGNSSSSHNNSTKKFKIVVLTEADRMSKDAQHGLRRTMEKYADTCRIIMTCESLSKVIEPIRSRCLAIRVAAPKVDEIVYALNTTAKREGIVIGSTLASNIAKYSNRNLRRALLMAEASKIQAGTNHLNDDVPIQLPDWERYVALLAKEIITKQSPDVLLNARQKLYELLANCIPPEIIFKSLVEELCRKSDDSLKQHIIYWASHYEAMLATQGQKPIFHLEAFIAKFMAMYREWLLSLFG